SGAAAARAAAAAHARAGTTTVVASLVTDEVDALAAQLTALTPLRAEGVLAGVHLEGPWLSPLHCGAHRAASLRAPAPDDVARLVEAGAGSLAMVTLAPELPGALDAVGRLAEAGVLVAIGHTDASYEVTRAAIEAGARMATHLHNACRPAHHREPGPAVALLEDPRVGIETIVDGVHLHPATVRRVAREAGERWILVSDAMAAAGCGDGEFPLGPLRVRVHDGVARVVGADGAAGAIAGSTATVAGSVRSAVAAGVDLDAALRAATAAPADALGLPDVGRLRVGSRADAVVLGPELEVRGVLRHGTWVKAAATAAAD
ncbi:N-acetylglucosamine-6-phosphate deacetylase, partial [Micrococcus luteus]|uniref:N-acetylglucosamine-6-phosphate deacetylase n=2 Tax=Micrococcaceae TaxID=1268 RepID=UPI001C8D71CC